jgi:hypothetical protein
MPFDKQIVKRIRLVLDEKGASFSEKQMFSGICFMVAEKMLCGTHIDKKSGESYLLCRVGKEAYETAIERDDCIPMEFTGKAMKGYVFVLESGFRNKRELSYWLQLCLDFNPKAKKSKKK